MRAINFYYAIRQTRSVKAFDDKTSPPEHDPWLHRLKYYLTNSYINITFFAAVSLVRIANGLYAQPTQIDDHGNKVCWISSTSGDILVISILPQGLVFLFLYIKEFRHFEDNCKVWREFQLIFEALSVRVLTYIVERIVSLFVPGYNYWILLASETQGIILAVAFLYISTNQPLRWQTELDNMKQITSVQFTDFLEDAENVGNFKQFLDTEFGRIQFLFCDAV
eukprot:501663_1